MLPPAMYKMVEEKSYLAVFKKPLSYEANHYRACMFAALHFLYH